MSCNFHIILAINKVGSVSWKEDLARLSSIDPEFERIFRVVHCYEGKANRISIILIWIFRNRPSFDSFKSLAIFIFDSKKEISWSHDLKEEDNVFYNRTGLLHVILFRTCIFSPDCKIACCLLDIVCFVKWLRWDLMN